MAGAHVADVMKSLGIKCQYIEVPGGDYGAVHGSNEADSSVSDAAHAR